MECHLRCPCRSEDVLLIIQTEQNTQRSNKDKRKSIYSELAMFLQPEDYSKGKIVSLPPCVIEKVRTSYPDKKFSSFDRYSKHLNR